MLVSSSEKFLWVCELNKDQPMKKWKALDIMELEDDEDKDYVINSLILKTAVLGSKCIEGERNLVAIKTKGYQDKEFEQPIFSLTLGKTDFVSGLDLTLASDHGPEVEFKLIEGTGPIFITCTHMIELPSGQEEHPTMLTETDGEMESIESGEEVEGSDEESLEKGKGKRQAALKNGLNGTNGLKNGKLMKAGLENGIEKEKIEATEK
jgi:hypothetical protein